MSMEILTSFLIVRSTEPQEQLKRHDSFVFAKVKKIHYSSFTASVTEHPTTFTDEKFILTLSYCRRNFLEG